MKSINDFIVYTDVVFNDTFKTANGVELFADKRFSQKRLAQLEVEIKELPLNYKGEDIKGYKALVDATIYFQNDYNHGKGVNNEIEGHKGFFKIQPSMIIAVRENESSEWVGFDDNLLVEQVMSENKETTSGLIILEIKKSEPVQGLAKVAVTNKKMIDDDVNVGDTIKYNDYFGVDVHIEGRLLKWIRVKDCLAKVV